MYGNTDTFVVLSQDMDDRAGPDVFADFPGCGMLDWSHSQQVGDLISVFWDSEAGPLVGIQSEMGEVSTCPAKDWSSAHQQADLVNVFQQVVPKASSRWIPVPFDGQVAYCRMTYLVCSVCSCVQCSCVMRVCNEMNGGYTVNGVVGLLSWVMWLRGDCG